MKALILVDLQNDFVAPGALPVPDGRAVVEVANRVMTEFDLVVATQDWHPSDHLSFASQHPGMQVGELFKLGGLQQVAWPDHCVQGTEGAELIKELHQSCIDHVIRKGTDRTIDSYSGFFDNGHQQATGLEDYLRANGVNELCILGLATDYCVRFTALDARQLGYPTQLLLAGCRGVELNPGDIAAAIAEMQAAGVEVI
jgi:nicotinamidase/pyrazinamidase